MWSRLGTSNDFGIIIPALAPNTDWMAVRLDIPGRSSEGFMVSGLGFPNNLGNTKLNQ
jgi:hypothetical protein